MSVWVVFPSKKSAAECNATLALWHAQGYRSAVFRDTGDERVNATIVCDGGYPGYAKVVNAMIHLILEMDRKAQWFVVCGDDIEPDPNHKANEIAVQCTEHFGGTFGIMQPTGDRWGEDPRMPNVRPDRAAYIDRVCGSPFIGREACERLYGGNGPYWEGWFHMWIDEELQCVAEMLGILWQRSDLIHFHRHWARAGRGARMPEYLRKANARFSADQVVFNERKALNFPGHEPLPVGVTA